MADNQYNPIAEVPEAALKKAQEDWGKKPVEDMRQELTRLDTEILQINQGGGIDSPVLGGDTASAEDRYQALTQRIAVRHYLTETLGKMDARERQLKQLAANLSAGAGGDDPLKQNLDVDPMGYERDRGVNHSRELGPMDQMLQHLGVESMEKQYLSRDNPSPLFQRLHGPNDVVLPMSMMHIIESDAQGAPTGTEGRITRERGPDRRRVDLPARDPELIDYLPMEQEPTGNYSYIQEVILSGADGGGNNAPKAKKVDEGAGDDEALFRDVRMSKEIDMVRVHTTATYEALNNTMRARRIIDQKLPWMIRQEVDRRALSDLVGLAGIGEILAPRAAAAATNRDVDGMADKLLQAQLVFVNKVGRTRANLCVLEPEAQYRFLTEKSTAGGYLIRSSAELSPISTAWGCPVVLATSGLSYGANDNIPAVVGDFMNFAVLAYAEQSGFRILDQHGTQATEMKYTFQSWWRAQVFYFRPSAFCRIKQTAPA